jgi:hypothetical protein
MHALSSNRELKATTVATRAVKGVLMTADQ